MDSPNHDAAVRPPTQDTRIEKAIEELVDALINFRMSGEGTPAATQKVKSTIRDILEMHNRRELTIAGYYEMLLYLIERLK